MIDAYDTTPAGSIEQPAKSRTRPVDVALSPALLALSVGAIALVIRAALLLLYPFDGLYGQDAYFYLTATRRLVEIWTQPERLWAWLTVPGTPPVSVWPLGYHLQMALVANVTGLGAASGQAISLAAGVLTPVWTALLALKLFTLPGRAGEANPTRASAFLGALLSGLAVALSALAVRASVVVMADMAGIHWATLGVLLTVLYVNDVRQRTWLGLLAGACLGIAAVTRYIYPLLLAPVALFAIVGAREWLRQGIRNAGHIARRLLPLAAVPVVLVALQLLHNLMHPMATLPSPVIATWDPLNAIRSSFEGPDGRQSYAQAIGYFYLVRPQLSTSALGSAFVPFFVLGLVALLRGAGLLRGGTALLAGWWLLFAGFYSGTIYQADRFVLSYLPPLAIIGGLGFTVAARLLWRLRSLPPSATRGLLLASAGLAIAGVLALTGLTMQARSAAADYRQIHAGKDDYLAATRCLESAAAPYPDAPVFSFAVTFTVEEYTRLEPRDLYYETPRSLETALNRGGSEVKGLLAMPLSGFEAQWGRTAMGEAFAYLRQNYNLVEGPCSGTSLTIFEIR